MALHVFCTLLSLKQSFSTEQETSCFGQPVSSSSRYTVEHLSRFFVFLGRCMLGG